MSADALPSQADAQRIAELEAEVVRLREALEPFAKMADAYVDDDYDPELEFVFLLASVNAATYADLYRARAALEHKEADRGQ